MIRAEKSQNLTPLEASKVQRRKAAAAVAELAIRASADLLDAQACESHVADLVGRRAAAIAAAKPADVLLIDGELLRARVSSEIATSRAAASRTRHGTAVAELHRAEGRVSQAARAQLDVDMVELAQEIMRAHEALVPRVAELRELSMHDCQPTALGAKSTLPPEVERALECLPRPNPLDVPLYLLRSEARSNRWSRRLAELVADE